MTYFDKSIWINKRVYYLIIDNNVFMTWYVWYDIFIKDIKIYFYQIVHKTMYNVYFSHIAQVKFFGLQFKIWMCIHGYYDSRTWGK